MRVLVVGGGGREHALVWKIAQSPLVERSYAAPGNPGIARLADCRPIGVNDFDALAALVREERIGLVVVGPEDPLSKGIADRLAETGAKVFGPTAAGAEIEASKSFAKSIMSRYGIPTAEYAEFDAPEPALDYIRSHGAPLVIKADGLAAGKGVTVAHDVDTAVAAVESMMRDRIFGDAGNRLVIEECLFGEEASILALTDGQAIIPLQPSQDHKPVFDGDTGPNTGGMGAYAPAPLVDSAMLERIMATILRPCIDGLAKEGRPYRGVLYAGLMITNDGPKVIEFNCRFGDPETQVVLPMMKSDIVPLFIACCDGTLGEHRVETVDGACVSVVMASGGYPGSYEKGKPISGIDDAESEAGVMVFHAGTGKKGDDIVTAGGRVLNVTAVDRDIPTAIAKAYRAVGKIAFDGAHHRTDIGAKAIRHL